MLVAAARRSSRRRCFHAAARREQRGRRRHQRQLHRSRALPGQLRLQRLTPVARHAIRKKREGDVFPASMPQGPWDSSEAAKAAIDGWCADVKLEAGGWGCSWRNLRPPNTSRGTQRVLGCHMQSISKSKCRWSLTLEESTAGWVVCALTSEHTHPLTQTLAESNSYAGMRCIPPEFQDIMRLLADAGQPPSAIVKVLGTAADRQGVPVTWNYNDVYTFVAATASERAFDATGTLEYLEERRRILGLPFFFTTDADGRLSCVFLVFAGGMEAYAKGIFVTDGVEVNETAVQYDLTVRGDV